MIKLKDLIKEHTVKFTKDEMEKLHKDGSVEKVDDEGKPHTYMYQEGGPGSGPHGDDEDNPFDKEPSDDDLRDIEKQFEGKLNEVDFDKIKLPSVVDRFLNKFVDAMKGANLNRLKRSAVLYKVIEASGMSVQQLMADIQKIKRELK
tara:strand:+ start:446 stop:886 length:441 start_codon:yes stop_codon:yes gene_type:complete